MSVLIGVLGAGDKVGSPNSAAPELGVGGENSGVDNVDTGSGTSSAVVDVAGGALDLVGDAAESPWGTGLGFQGVDRDLGILLDPGDLLQC